MTQEFVFLPAEGLRSGEMTVDKLLPAVPEKGYVPSYLFHIRHAETGDVMGGIALRIGYNENIRYGGHIGYGVNPEHRGHRYAAKAVKLVLPLAKAHGLKEVIITCNPDNWPSRKTCERVGAVLREIVDIPEHNEMYLRGERRKCIYILPL